MLYYFMFLALFAARKIADQRRSRRQVRELEQSSRLLPSRDRAYPFLLGTHLAFFVLTPLEIIVAKRVFHPVLGIAMIALFVAATLLRYWSTALLARNWSSMVVVPEDLQPATGGPYRVIRHPNYLAMSLELLALGLMYSAWLATIVVTVLNAIAVVTRIRSEEEVLFQVPAYRAAMQGKARLIPGIF